MSDPYGPEAALRVAYVALQQITDQRRRQALNALWVGAMLRHAAATGVPLLDRVPRPLQVMSLVHCASGGGPPAPELAAWLRARVPAWGDLNDDEAALGLWAGMAPEDVGFGATGGGGAALDAWDLARRMIAWGVPAELSATLTWIRGHLSGRGADAAVGLAVQHRRPLDAALATDAVAAVADPAIQLDALVHVAVATGADGAHGARWSELAEAALLRADPTPTLLAQAAAVSVHARADVARDWLALAQRGLGALPVDQRPSGYRWVAMVAARRGCAAWSAEVAAFFADRAWFGLKDKREALAVDALGLVESLYDRESTADSAANVVRENLRRLEQPRWRAVGVSLLFPLVARAPGRSIEPLRAELLALVVKLAGDEDAAGAHLPAILRRVAGVDPQAAFELAGALPTPTLRAFAATSLCGAVMGRGAPA